MATLDDEDFDPNLWEGENEDGEPVEEKISSCPIFDIDGKKIRDVDTYHLDTYGAIRLALVEGTWDHYKEQGVLPRANADFLYLQYGHLPPTARMVRFFLQRHQGSIESDRYL